MTQRRTKTPIAVLALAALAACHGSDAPRGSLAVLTHEARRAVLSGTAGGSRPTLDLAPGCGGFVDDGPPDQVIDVKQAMKLDFVARSTRGPVSLVVVGDDGALCDGDGGTGHAPRVHTVAPGRYRVWVAAMHPNEHLPYELTVAPPAKDEGSAVVAGGGPVAGGTISVTVMSTPAGAEVRSPTGQVLGQTPAMFEYPASAQPTATLAFVVDAPGHQAATVSGVPTRGELVLNAVLGGSTPQIVIAGGGRSPLVNATTFSAEVPQHIRDYGTATQTLAWPTACVIENLAVDTVVRHTCPSDLRMRITSPSGTTVTLWDHAGRGSPTRTWNASDAHGALAHLIGQDAHGTWTMTVRDDVDADVGTFQSFAVHVQCAGAAGAGQAAAPATAPALQVATGTVRTTSGPDVIDPWH